MYRDKTLIPTEALRLAALGTLAQGPARYSALSRDVRGFAARIAGPTLDILGSSIELLRHEGLVETPTSGVPTSGVPTGGAPDGETDADDPMLTLTERGRDALTNLMAANVRSPTDGVSKLVLALKLRFLHLLSPAEQQEQVALIIEMSEQERARLTDLAAQHRGADGLLGSWLDHELAQVDARIDWLDQIKPTT